MATYTGLKKCGKGWDNLIEETLKKLPDHVIIDNIKEKFGELCIYPREYIKDIDEILFDAQRKSKTICELCGIQDSSVDKQYYIDGSWLRTLCAKCRKEENALRIPRQQIDREIINKAKKAARKNIQKD